jgi:hypothetical protein
MVGGKLISGFYQGVVAGEIALRVLRGENPDSTPVVRFAADRPNRYMFDYLQLQRFGIPLSALPKDGMIENMPASFFRRHPMGTLAGSALFVILIVMNSVATGVRARSDGRRYQEADRGDYGQSCRAAIEFGQEDPADRPHRQPHPGSPGARPRSVGFAHLHGHTDPD